jgi:hypothetical protein
MKRGRIEFRGGAALHVGKLGSFVSNDEGAFELTKILGVNPEVSLKRMFHLYARGHVNE